MGEAAYWFADMRQVLSVCWEVSFVARRSLLIFWAWRLVGSMVRVKSTKVLSGHPFFAVERSTCQWVVIDDVGNETPLVWE